MTTNVSPQLGPVLLGTLTCQDLQAHLASYCEHLHLDIAEQGQVSPELAALWQTPEIAGAPMALLANKLGEPWLRIVEDKTAERLEPMRFHGWMSLEVSVEDVDALAEALADTPFNVLRPPAYLDISDQLRACQVEGPCGELFYFTEIKGPVPGFDLEPARSPVDKIFIPVLCTPDRQASGEFYNRLGGKAPFYFNTVISVVNQSWESPLDTRHPLATVSLNGANVIEIDELTDAKDRPRSGHLPSGIASISFAVSAAQAENIEWLSAPRAISCAPYNGRKVGLAKGAANEWAELIIEP